MSESNLPAPRPDPLPGSYSAAPHLPHGHTHGHDHVPLREYVTKLRRHGWLLALAGALGFGFAFWRVQNERPEYRATAVIRMTQEQRTQLPPGLDGGLGDAGFGYGTDRILSQIQVLRSRGVVGDVVDSAGMQLQLVTDGVPRRLLSNVAVLTEIADTLRLEFGADGAQVVAGQGVIYEAAYGEPLELPGIRFTIEGRPEAERAVALAVPREAAIDLVLENLEAHPRERTNVVDLEYTAHDPWLAQQVVNQAARTFRSLSAHAAQQSARLRREFVQDQLVETDSLLARAQLSLSDFRRREQVYSSRERFAARQTGLMDIDVRREELAADRAMIGLLLERIERTDEATNALRTAVATPGLATNPVVAQLYAQLVEYESRLDSLTTGAFASARTNPDVERLETLIADTRSRLKSAVESHVAVLDARIEALSGLRSRYAAEMADLPEIEAEEARLVQNLETLRRVADMLREELQRARIAEAVEGGQVEIVDLAASPGDRVPSGRTRTLVLGLMLGLMAGGAGALVLENLNTSIRRKDELEGLLQVPGLALIPRIGDSGGRLAPLSLPGVGQNGTRRVANGNGASGSQAAGLVALRDRQSTAAEAYRSLRTNLLFSHAVKTLNSVVITSAAPAEGKTTTAGNLATTFAQQGLRVLLLDCDLRNARLHQLFSAPRDPGLTQVITGQIATADAIRATEVENLWLMPAGVLPPNPSELLGGRRMRSLVEQLGAEYDLVVIDSPPLGAAADAAILGSIADGVLLVVRAGQTDRGAAQHALQQLANVGARVLGAVLNDPDAKAEEYGNYVYTDYYHGSRA